MTTIRSINLASRENGADKIYNIIVEGTPSGLCNVTAFSGRRGGTLTRQDKTPKLATRAEADKIFDKLVKEKKGGSSHYVEVGGETTTVTSADATQTELRPQLANDIAESDVAEWVASIRWGVQEKFNGKRMMLRVGTQDISIGNEVTVEGINRTGKTCGLPAVVAEAGALLPDCVLDGELVGDVYHAFDLYNLGAGEPWHQTFSARYAALETLALQYLHGVTAIQVAPLACHPKSKSAYIAALTARRAEGVIFRNLSALYTPGRPNSGGDLLRWKWTASASCIVTGQRDPNVRSVSLALLSDNSAVDVGNVGVPVNYPLPAAGAVVEIKYLYAHKGGSLVQPIYLGERDDIPAADCTLSQLKYKPDAQAQAA